MASLPPLRTSAPSVFRQRIPSTRVTLPRARVETPPPTPPALKPPRVATPQLLTSVAAASVLVAATVVIGVFFAPALAFILPAAVMALFAAGYFVKQAYAQRQTATPDTELSVPVTAPAPATPSPATTPVSAPAPAPAPPKPRHSVGFALTAGPRLTPQAQAYLRQLQKPGTWCGELSVAALADLLDIRIRTWHKPPGDNAVPPVFVSYDGNLTGDAQSEHTAHIARDSGHYVWLNEGTTQSGTLTLIGPPTVDAGGNGDCLILALAYDLNVHGFRDALNAYRADDTESATPNTTADERFRALRDEVNSNLRQRMVQHIRRHPEKFAELADSAALTNAADLIDNADDILVSGVTSAELGRWGHATEEWSRAIDELHTALECLPATEERLQQRAHATLQDLEARREIAFEILAMDVERRTT